MHVSVEMIRCRNTEGRLAELFLCHFEGDVGTREGGARDAKLSIHQGRECLDLGPLDIHSLKAMSLKGRPVHQRKVTYLDEGHSLCIPVNLPLQLLQHSPQELVR